MKPETRETLEEAAKFDAWQGYGHIGAAIREALAELDQRAGEPTQAGDVAGPFTAKEAQAFERTCRVNHMGDSEREVASIAWHAALAWAKSEAATLAPSTPTTPL